MKIFRLSSLKTTAGTLVNGEIRWWLVQTIQTHKVHIYVRLKSRLQYQNKVRLFSANGFCINNQNVKSECKMDARADACVHGSTQEVMQI